MMQFAKIQYNKTFVPQIDCMKIVYIYIHTSVSKFLSLKLFE